MKPGIRIAAAGGALALVLAGLALAYRAGRSAGTAQAARGTSGEPPSEVTASVAVVPLQEGTLSRELDAYGSVVPAPEASSVLSLPFDCQVIKVVVSEGQAVSKGALLLSVTGSPDARLALAQAKADAEACGETLKQVQARHALKLADDAALAQARGAAESAQARLRSLEARRMDAVHDLRAATDGVVLRLPFASGAVAPAGAALAEVADGGRLEARFGLEPAERGWLTPGAAAVVRALDGGSTAPVAGRVRAVSTAVNPATRLVDVFVTLPSGCPLPLGAYVAGSFTASSASGLLAPYAAVLPGESGSVLFTVKEGKAVRHLVSVVDENDEAAIVSGPGLLAGDLAVVSGNYELQDGMAVKVEVRP